MKNIIKKYTFVFLVVTIVLIGVIIFALKGDQSKVFKIGVIAPLSGVAADYGEEIRKGILASAHGDIEFVFEDDKCEPKEAVTAFKKLTDFQEVRFIIGPACGSSQEAVVPPLKEKGVIAIVPSAASSALYDLSGGNLYNTQYSLEDESAYIAKKMFERGYTRVALISYQNVFSKTHADSFRKHFRGSIVADSVFVDPSADISTDLVKIKASKPQAIYSPDISFFFAGGMRKLKQFNFSIPVFSTYVTELPVARSLVPEVFYSFPADITDGQGAVYGLSKQSAEILASAVSKCSGKTTCAKEALDSSGEFDVNGVFKRGLVLKQIKDSKAELLR